MKTRTVVIASATAAVALFAGSFALARQVDRDEPYPVDPPIAVPPIERELATVLGQGGDPFVSTSNEQPGEGAAPDALAQLSPEVGTMLVTRPSAEEASVPAEIVALAAALDVAFGETSPAVGDDAHTEPTPAPRPTSGARPSAAATPSPSAAPADAPPPASDPCAPTDGAPDESCPEGVTATLFSLDMDATVQVWAAADPVTGPGMGSSIWCAAGETEVPGEGRLRLGALATHPATVTVTYWPVSHPADLHTTTLQSVQTFDEGSSRHCGVSDPLAEGRYQGSAIAISDDGRISGAWPLDFDSRGRPTEPLMRTVPLGTNWLWVGVYHAARETALIDGFPLVEGGPTTCADASSPDFANIRADIPPHTSTVPFTWLEANNYNSAYTRVTSALLYLPEGTSAGICGLTFAGGEPSWDSSVPERVQFTTASAPDSWEAVVTVRELSVFQGGSVMIDARGHMGSYCGPSSTQTVDIPRSDTATTVAVGDEICRISGQNIQVGVTTFFTPETGGSATEERSTRFALMGANCTGPCPAPEPRTYTVFLPGLGQDQCPDRATDDCELRRRTLGARAIIDVTWEQGGGNERSTWATGGVADARPEDEPSEGARFDTDASLTWVLSRDGFAASARTVLKWDRAVDYSVRVVGECFAETYGAPAPAPLTGRALPDTAGVFAARLSIGGLCPGAAYGLVVTYTDDAGVTSTAAASGVEGVSPDVLWDAGGGVAPQRWLNVKAAVEVTRNDRVEASYLVRDSFVYVGYGRLTPSFGPTQRDRCFNADVSASDSAVTRTELRREYDVSAELNVYTDWYYYPTSPTCEWRAWTRWVPQSNAHVTLDQLLRGVVIEGTMVPHDFPEGGGTEEPFTYRITLRGEFAED